jgi:SAM-dependent MidA family methyltransferase
MLQSMDGKAPGPVTLKKLRSLKMLLHPETMGAQFKVILFSKNTPESKHPSGFLHAKDPRYLLETSSTFA